jgi:50S ribosomal protein L16 3-hydroxylase
MKHWETEQEWVLEPGAMLYLPPGVSHYGVALNDCITVSVGFRAPNVTGMLIDFAERFIETADAEQFYADPQLTVQEDPAELSLAARERIREAIRAIDLSDEGIDRWFGSFITEPKPGHEVILPESSLTPANFRKQLTREGALLRSEYCRFVHYVDGAGVLHLFVAGDELQPPPELLPVIRHLSDQREYSAEDLLSMADSAEALQILAELYNRGALYFPDL